MLSTSGNQRHWFWGEWADFCWYFYGKHGSIRTEREKVTVDCAFITKAGSLILITHKPFCLFTIDLGTNKLFAVKQQSSSNPLLTTIFTTENSHIYYMPQGLPVNFKGSEAMVGHGEVKGSMKAPFAGSIPELSQMLKCLSLPLLSFSQFYIVFFSTWETALPFNNLKCKTVSLSYLTYS